MVYEISRLRKCVTQSRDCANSQIARNIYICIEKGERRESDERGEGMRRGGRGEGERKEERGKGRRGGRKERRMREERRGE